jgi:hypothetical protein
MAQSVVAGPSQWRLGFDPKSVRVTLVVDKVVWDRFFRGVLRFSSVNSHSTNPDIFIYMLFLSGQTGEAKQHWMESAFTSFLKS